jgi:chromosome segregation protein
MSDISKIRELINKNESKMNDLDNAIRKARDTFSSESRKVIDMAARVNIELDDWNKKMGTHEERISELEEKRQSLKSEVGKQEQKTKETEKQYSSASSETKSTQKEIERIQNTLEQHDAKKDTLKTEIERLDRDADENRKNMESMKLANQKEFDDLENGKKEFQEKIKDLAEKEPITHLLLTESESEAPEVTIVAKLVQEDGQISINDLKKTTKINSSAIPKTIEALEQKGIVSKVDKDTIRLLKK